MRKVWTAGFIAIAAATAAYGQSGGPVVSRAFPVRGFDRIESAGPYHVEVRTGSATRVSASGPRQLVDRMIVEVRGGELKIYPRRERQFVRSNDRRRVTVAVTVPQLRGAELAGSGNMRIDQVRGRSFDGSIAGSGDLLVGGVNVGALKLSVAGSGDARTGRGSARSVDISIAGSGAADTRSTRSPTASISIAGSGRASAFANRTATVAIIGSGDAEVVGGARCTVSRAGSGRARCS